MDIRTFIRYNEIKSDQLEYGSWKWVLNSIFNKESKAFYADKEEKFLIIEINGNCEMHKVVEVKKEDDIEKWYIENKVFEVRKDGRENWYTENEVIIKKHNDNHTGYIAGTWEDFHLYEEKIEFQKEREDAKKQIKKMQRAIWKKCPAYVLSEKYRELKDEETHRYEMQWRKEYREER